MKMNGEQIKGVNYEIIPIIRPDRELFLRATAIISWDEFNKLLPEPKPPKITKKGGITEENYQDENYKAAIQQYSQSRLGWMIITSLKDSKGLEWEKIKYDDPNTWHLFEEELKEADFTRREIDRIVEGVWSANGLDEIKVEAARQRFLAGQEKE